MRLFVVLGTLFAGACCTSLPRLPAKSTSFPPLRAERERVGERSEVWHDPKRNRDVPVKIYGDSGPVVVVSHGIGEDRDAYAYLGRALARHGFTAVHVTHAGTDRAVLERGYRHLYRAVKQKENWINRPRDVSFVLDRLGATEAAVVGHSAGAFTAFALAGLRMTGGTLDDPRVKVAVAMSMPRMEGVVAPGGYDAIAIPLLNVTGTCDTSLLYRTFPRHRRIPFEETHAARQYLVTLDRVNHDTFVVEDPRNAQIVDLTIAFLRAWMLGDAAARAWFDDPGTGAVGGVRLSVERKNGTAR
ncbi:MAG TPA: alpha/beta fold hydrolase [Thermoanaerobaculia bacterium]|nr:alpha/beta fold hydrolase [Thermoanaerobaculia bacterium]